MSTYKALVFDYFGVVSSDEYWDFVGEDKQSHDEFHELADKVNLGKVDWDDFCDQVAKETGRSVEQVEAMYDEHTLNRPLAALIRQLKGRYKTALVSNAHHNYIMPLLNQTKLDQLFDSVIVSSVVGAIKPSPKIYQATAKALGVEPKECVFIDDQVRNVNGAEHVGMHGLLYQNTNQLMVEFKERGII